jgi:hypothetical protein
VISITRKGTTERIMRGASGEQFAETGQARPYPDQRQRRFYLRSGDRAFFQRVEYAGGCVNNLLVEFSV